jgi:hypothetical protein
METDINLTSEIFDTLCSPTTRKCFSIDYAAEIWLVSCRVQSTLTREQIMRHTCIEIVAICLIPVIAVLAMPHKADAGKREKHTIHHKEKHRGATATMGGSTGSRRSFSHSVQTNIQ